MRLKDRQGTFYLDKVHFLCFNYRYTRGCVEKRLKGCCMKYDNKPKIDYVFKSMVMRNGLDKVERTLSYSCFTKRDYSEYLEVTAEMTERGNEKAWKEAQKINHAFYERRKRLSKRIETFMFDKDTGEYRECIFVTLTFKDEVFTKTNAEQRRKRVCRYLKSLNCPYVANIDFGEKKGREHYHACVQATSIDGLAWREQNGSINFERVRARKPDDIAKYISKLTNHAIKETTHRQALIYSR